MTVPPAGGRWSEDSSGADSNPGVHHLCSWPGWLFHNRARARASSAVVGSVNRVDSSRGAQRGRTNRGEARCRRLEHEARERERRFARSDGVDADGRRLDRRESLRSKCSCAPSRPTSRGARSAGAATQRPCQSSAFRTSLRTTPRRRRPMNDLARPQRTPHRSGRNSQCQNPRSASRSRASRLWRCKPSISLAAHFRTPTGRVLS